MTFEKYNGEEIDSFNERLREENLFKKYDDVFYGNIKADELDHKCKFIFNYISEFDEIFIKNNKKDQLLIEIEGRGGTGKSNLIKQLLKKFKNRIKTTSLTGCASILI